MPCDSAKTNDFAERLNHGADEEVAAEFDGVRLARFRADDRDAARERLQHGPGCGNGSFVAGHHDPELAGLGHIGPAEDGCGDEPVSAPRVLGREPLAECDADGAAGDVKRAGLERVHAVRWGRRALLRAPHRRTAW